MQQQSHGGGVASAVVELASNMLSRPKHGDVELVHEVVAAAVHVVVPLEEDRKTHAAADDDQTNNEACPSLYSRFRVPEASDIETGDQASSEE